MKLVLLFGNQLGFEIQCNNNRTATQIYNDLEAVRLIDHRQYDCFVCFVLSHGRMDEIYGVDGASIGIKDITGLFSGVKCQSLAGKPKVFFINACQGNARQLPVRPLQHDGPSSPNIGQLPNECDLLVCSSTVPGHASFRSPEAGSWYVISLVAIMKKHHSTMDVTNLLYKVNNHLSKCCDMQGFKQCASISSTLRHSLYFT